MTTLVVVVAVAVLLGVTALRSRLRSTLPTEQRGGGDDLQALRTDTERALASWCPVLAQGRDLSDEELQKYVNFVIVARACVVSLGQGRTWGGKDLEAACNWRDARVAESVVIHEQMAAAGRELTLESEATGSDEGPAGTRAKELVKLYERILRDAGEVNELRRFWRDLNNSAERLRINDLLPTFIVEDPGGLLTLAEARYMRALVRASQGDSSDLAIASLVLEQQNGVKEPSTAQTARITAAIERGLGRDTGPDAGAGDPAMDAYLGSEDFYWSARARHCLDSRTSDGPCLVSSADANRFRAFIAAKRAAGLAVAEGRAQSCFTAVELEQATKIGEENAAAAAALESELTEAHQLWADHILSTGEVHCEQGDHAISVSEKVENLAWEGGDFNRFMWALTWRFAKLDALRGQRITLPE